jgi:hypothetical protein
MCNLGWANEKGLVLKVKPKIKLACHMTKKLLCNVTWFNAIQNRWWNSNI